MATWMGAVMPANPGHFGKPWFLPIVGACSSYKDLVT
jgi:hypothetical protein